MYYTFGVNAVPLHTVSNEVESSDNGHSDIEIVHIPEGKIFLFYIQGSLYHIKNCPLYGGQIPSTLIVFIQCPL